MRKTDLPRNVFCPSLYLHRATRNEIKEVKREEEERDEEREEIVDGEMGR